MSAADPDFPRTLTEAAGTLRTGALTSVALTTTMLARGERLDPVLVTYLARFDEQAIASATLADAELASGIDRGPLHGIPVAVKDILAAQEGPTTAQSLVLDPAWGQGKDAPIVARLRAAGAVITGKTTTAEFACGMPDETKPFPIPRNPWDVAVSPGGSSAGTGSGIAAGMFFAGIGTDTGGSIRCPAAFCGISGLKPTFGRVPKSGCAPLGYSLDNVGPMARSARDCAAMLHVLAGYHPSDPGSANVPVSDYLKELGRSLQGVRIGIDRVHHFPQNGDPAMPGCFDAAVSALEDLGATVVEVTLPYFEEMVAAAFMVWCAEGLAYHRDDLRSRWGDYTAGARVMLARGALLSGADYVQAQRVRRAALQGAQELFAAIDLVVTPTAAIPAISYDDTDFDHMFEVMFTPYWNSVGYPALAVPMGFNNAELPLPLSLQFVGRPFHEALVLGAADAYQAVTDWHLRVPPMVLDSAPALT
jgi:aspartyl-tRNA(Asn)/glutamyl-tRNA(Gln) amidotransferase subunit A